MSLRQRSRSKTPQKQDRSALKNIVDPFLSWHSSLFDSCIEEIKKFPDHSKLVEETFSSDGAFEVNEETLYNILTADIQGNSKIESSSALQILPVIPSSIAKRIKGTDNSRSPVSEDSFQHDIALESSGSLEPSSTITNKIKFSFSDDFVDTENVCKNLRHLKIVNEFMNNSAEYLQFKKSTKN